MVFSELAIRFYYEEIERFHGSIQTVWDSQEQIGKKDENTMKNFLPLNRMKVFICLGCDFRHKS